MVLENTFDGEVEVKIASAENPPPGWDYLGKFEASSETQAKRLAITEREAREYGPLVAVPERFWNPTTPTVTAQTVLKIEGV
jgi:hypothetical protein